jgi:hypothetical protein
MVWKTVSQKRTGISKPRYITWHQLVAFVLGMAMMLFITWGWHQKLQQDKRELVDALNWAVQRGVRAEGLLILCRQQQQAKPQ